MKEKLYYKNCWYTSNHKKFSHFYHNYLFVRTNEYEILIYGWQSALPYSNIDFLEGGSRIVIKSRISGALLERRLTKPDYHYAYYIETLSKTKNRNREIWNLECELALEVSGGHDFAIEPLHDTSRESNFYYIY